MKLTSEELIDTWRYFQYCCLPSIVMAKYAYFDYIEDIRKEKTLYRHEVKKTINKVGKCLETLPNRLADISSQYKRYMNIVSDNIEEQFEEDTEELHKAIFLTFKNAKMKPLECLAAIHYISAMLQLASLTFKQCCHDLKCLAHKDLSQVFQTYNLHDLCVDWHSVETAASKVFNCTLSNKKCGEADLNNARCLKAIATIRLKYANIETLRVAMEKSYPWSPNYKEGLPYEESADYFITH